MKKLVVFYDETCGMCKRVMNILARLGCGHRVVYREAMTMEEYFNNPDALANRYYDLYSFAGNDIFHGYDTYVQIAKRTVLLIPFYPIMLIPPVKWIGQKIYRRIADQRTCAIHQNQ